jgi:serine protease Do
MAKVKVFWNLFWILAPLVAAVAVAADGGSRLFPFPLVEVERVIDHWFTASGYRTQLHEAASGEVSLNAQKAGEDCHLVLKPSSPLFTEVSAQCTGAGTPDSESVTGLWTLLDGYTQGARLETPAKDALAPPAVLQHHQAVVCMENSPGPGHLQLSGFVCDESGLILTTAHDVKESSTLTIFADNGQPFSGRAVKVDYLRDLALIQSNFRPAAPISLARARLSLEQGEAIFTIGCPQGSSGAVYAGIVNSPPRLANALPLWQVSLKVLPGSSGSPVFDGQGNLAGVIKGRYRGTDSVGFLIPMSTVKEFLGR